MLQFAVQGSQQYKESLSQGKFVVTEQEIDLEKEVTTIQAYDMMGILGNTQYAHHVVGLNCRQFFLDRKSVV